MLCLRFALSLFFCLWLAAALPAAADESEITALNVMADPALAIPLTQLASEYSAEKHISVNVTYAPSFEQALAVESGTEVDLIITGHTPTLDKLEKRGLLDKLSIRPLVKTPLVLAGSLQSPLHHLKGTLLVRNLFGNNKNLLAIAIPATSTEGYFAGKLLNSWQAGQGIYLGSTTVEMQNAEEIAAFASQPQHYGILLAAEAMQYHNLRILESFELQGQSVSLFSGIIENHKLETTLHFLNFLSHNAAQRKFAQAGFMPAFPIPNQE